MDFPWYSFLAVFFSTTLIVGFLTPLMRQFALKKSILDLPKSNHKTHSTPVPYLGGVAIVIGVTFTLLFFSYFIEVESRKLVLAVLLPAIALAVMGLLDDVWNLDPLPRFIFQNFVALISAFFLVNTDSFGAPTGSMIIDIGISILFIVGLCNAINFFDNIDGGASGTVAISSFALFFICLEGAQFYLASLSIVLAGGTLGFLRWNRSPARIYMGDAGSLFLGTLLSILLIRLDPSTLSSGVSFFVPLFLVAMPIMDASVAILSRISRGLSPFRGGRDHLSHRLVFRGLSKKNAVFVLWLLTGYFALLSIVLSIVPMKLEIPIVLWGCVSWTVCFFFFIKQKHPI